MRITWLGHSCFKLTSADGTIIFDPSENGRVPGYAFLPENITADMVICSHSHRDHSAAELIKLSQKPFGGRITQLSGWHDDVQGKKRGENTMTMVETEGLKAVHLGDIGCELSKEQAAVLSGADVLMIPVGGYYTVEPETAKKIADELGAVVVIPMHYRSGNLGYEEIAELERYTSLCDDVCRYSENFIEIEKDTPAQTAVLTYLPEGK